MKVLQNAAIVAALLAVPSQAAAEENDPGGILNPDEMSLNRSLSRAMKGEVDMVICAQGYLMTKQGNHGDARTIFKNCADKGWTGTMTWMSYMDENGFGGDRDPVAAAEWDKKAAERGDPIGQFNYGLDLLRGHGVAQDPDLGRSYVDRAAKQGLDVARELKASDYDWESVTPDADEWKYKKVF